MNKKLFYLGAALLAVSFAINLANGARPTPLNVKAPLDAMKNALQAFLDAFKLIPFLVVLIEILNTCLLPILQPPSNGTAFLGAMPDLSVFQDPSVRIQLAHQISQFPLDKMLEKVHAPQFDCSSDDFKILHDFVWKTDSEFPDLLRFLHRFGYPDIYDTVKKVYLDKGCSAELIADLPTADNPLTPTTSGTPKLPNVRGQYLESLNHPQDDKKCDILGIIGKLPETGMIQLVQFISEAYHQFSTNPSLHFLIGKIQEPAKGTSVRKFRLLKPIRDLLAKIHEDMKNDETWQELFAMVKDLTNGLIDFNVLNPVSLIVSLFEFLVWGTPIAP